VPSNIPKKARESSADSCPVIDPELIFKADFDRFTRRISSSAWRYP